MLDKLCERKAGYLGFWVGNFKDVEDFYRYIQSFYCIFGIPSCKYGGAVKKISNEWGELEFLGNIEENFYSNDIAEEYNS